MYRITTNRGREFSVGEDCNVPYFDVNTLSINECKPEDCIGKFLYFKKPIISSEEKSSINDIKLTNDLGWVISQIYSKGFIGDSHYYVMFPSKDVSDRFESISKSILDDSEINDIHHLLHLDEMYRCEGKLITVFFRSDKLKNILSELKITPRNYISYYDFIKTPIQFREGFFSGLFDSCGKILKFKRKKEGTIYYEIPLMSKYSHDIYYVFDAICSLDINISYCKKNDSGSPVTEIFIDPMEFLRRKDIFSNCANSSLVEKIKTIDNMDRLQNRLDVVPYSKEIYNDIIKLKKKDLHYWRNEWSNMINRKMAIKQINAVDDNIFNSERLYNWSKLVLDKTTKFEFYTKIVKKWD